MTQRARRTRNLAGLCILFTALGLVFYGFGFVPLILAELSMKDRFIAHGLQGGTDPRLVFIGITQPTYEDVISPEEAAADPTLAKLTGGFPWTRDVWAAAIERLAGAGADAIMLDLVFAAEGQGDDALRRALDRYPNKVVIGANFVGEEDAKGSASIQLPSESVLNVSNNAPIWSDPRVGYVNVIPDMDDVVRRATFRITGQRGLPPNGTMKSLTARALEKYRAANLLPSDNEAHLFRFSGPPRLGYKPIPLYEIFLPNHWTNNFASGKFFAGKIIIIGPAANIMHDEHRTPYPGGAMLGPEIHLNIIAAALRGEFLGESTYHLNLALIAALGATAFLLAAWIPSPVRRLIIAIGAVAVHFVICWALYRYANYFVLALTPIFVFSGSTLAGFTYDFILLRLEKNRTRRTLERYVSKDVVHELLDNPQTYLNTLTGVRKPVTIMFSDVRGFTTMTEGADPAKLVTQLNEYFKEMVGIVFAQKGSLDKFIGDAVMALWGSITTEGLEKDAQHAVASALAMKKALARLNVNWQQRGMKELAFGIGVNHGDVIVGNLGSDEKMEVSVIGDAVNLASRLEGLTKEYKLDLLLGETMVPLVQSRFVLRTVGSVQVKGKTIPVRIFTVMADKEANEQPPVWLPRYEQGIKLYRERKFSEAEEIFLECVRAAPEDYLSKVYLDECRELIAHPPGLDWNTVVIMKSK